MVDLAALPEPTADMFGADIRGYLHALVTWEHYQSLDQVRTIPPAGAAGVVCVCGAEFKFKDGATRARCPGCGCKFELTKGA